MKKLPLLLLLMTISTSLYAGTFSSFKANQFYSAEGRWFSVQGKKLFKINEGNSNEESLSFETAPAELAFKVKYKLCFKVKADCHLDCKAEVIKKIKLLEPWEDAKPLTPKPTGEYNEISEKACLE